MLPPRESGRFVSERAKNVHIVSEGIKRIATLITSKVKSGDLAIEKFKQNEIMPIKSGLSQDQLVDWVFLVDSINFSFWTDSDVPRYTVTHNGMTRVGYLAMVLAINRAIDNNLAMWNPVFYSKLTLSEMKDIFKSDNLTEMPMIEKRLEILHEVGKILVDKFQGSFVNVVKKSGLQALKLVDLIVEHFPSYRDIASYEGQSIAILKRAQIVVADLWVLHSTNTLNCFQDIDQITMFADYRVPQVLLYYGALQYSSRLQELLASNKLFQSGDSDEVEIRCCSITAVEKVVAEANTMLSIDGCDTRINSILVDFFLWDTSSQFPDKIKQIPYHKTRCIYY